MRTLYVYNNDIADSLKLAECWHVHARVCVVVALCCCWLIIRPHQAVLTSACNVLWIGVISCICISAWDVSAVVSRHLQYRAYAILQHVARRRDVIYLIRGVVFVVVHFWIIFLRCNCNTSAVSSSSHHYIDQQLCMVASSRQDSPQRSELIKSQLI